jgi:hypothetical protein
MLKAVAFEGGRLMKLVVSALAGVVSLAVGCGSTMPPPNDRLASSEAAIRGAKELGAQNDPQAALHIRLADEEVASARNLMRDGDNKRADLVLQRAKADAELAVVLTKEKAAKTSADEAKKSLDAKKTGEQ